MAKKADGAPDGYAQLRRDLKEKNLSRFYIFYGEEDYLRKNYWARLRDTLLDDLTADFNFHRMNAETFSVDALADSLEALPMMAERSLVLVEDVDFFALSETERERAAALLADVPEYCCLVLSYESFSPDKRKKRLWEAMEKNAVLVEFAYQNESELRAWIQRHFRHHGKSIAPELCSYLLQQCGQSMTRLNGEIEKLCSYSGAETIVRADIDAVVEPTLDAVVFQISDALAQRDFGRALERLHVLLKLQTDPIPIVAAIGTQMRRLYAARLLEGAGKTADELAQLTGMRSFAANKTMSQARRLSLRFCRTAVELCCQTDQQLKSSYAEGEQLAELLILRLAEEARHD